MNHPLSLHDATNASGTRAYHADIMGAGAGNFTATLRDNPSITINSPDPEHALCFAMLSAGLPDGEIQFWRGSTRSLFYRSVHRAAGYRVKMGETFPYQLVKREGAPAVFAKDRGRGVTQNRETPSAGRGQPASMGAPDAMVSLCEAHE